MKLMRNKWNLNLLCSDAWLLFASTDVPQRRESEMWRLINMRTTNWIYKVGKKQMEVHSMLTFLF